MDKTTIFNIVAIVLAIVMPVLVGEGYTGDVPAGWAFIVPFAFNVINIILKWASKTERGQAMNV